MEGAEKSPIMGHVENWIPTRLVETPELSEADSLSSYLSAPSSIPAAEQQTDDLSCDIISKETICVDQINEKQKLAELSPDVVSKEIYLVSAANDQQIDETSDIVRNAETNLTPVSIKAQGDDASLGFISAEPVVGDSVPTEHIKNDCEQHQTGIVAESAENISFAISDMHKVALPSPPSLQDNLSCDIIIKQKSPSSSSNKKDDFKLDISNTQETRASPVSAEEIANSSFGVVPKVKLSSSPIPMELVDDLPSDDIGEQKTIPTPTQQIDDLAFDVVKKQSEISQSPLSTQGVNDLSFHVDKKQNTSLSPNPSEKRDSSSFNIFVKRKRTASPIPTEADNISFEIIKKPKTSSNPPEQVKDLTSNIKKQNTSLSPIPSQIDDLLFDDDKKQITTTLSSIPTQKIDDIPFDSIEKQITIKSSPAFSQEANDLLFDGIKTKITENLSSIPTQEVDNLSFDGIDKQITTKSSPIPSQETNLSCDGVEGQTKANPSLSPTQEGDDLSFDATKKQIISLSPNPAEHVDNSSLDIVIKQKQSPSPIPTEQISDLSFDLIEKQNSTSSIPTEKVNDLSFDIITKQKTSLSLTPAEQNDNSSFDVVTEPTSLTETEKENNLSFDVINKQNNSLTVDPSEHQTDELSLDIKESLTPNPTDQQADDLSFDIISRQKLSLTPISSGSVNHDRSSPKGGPVVHIFEEDTRSSWSVDSAKVPFKETAIDDDSQNSSSSQKSSKKKKNSDDDDATRAFSAENLFEYMWPQENGEFCFLQEQVSDYLSVKSFKRKYPDLTRRQVELNEKQLLREKGVVTETQCELGLTALRSEDVMELMSRDYPEKYKDYIGILREKEKQTISEKRKEYAATSSDKTKVVDFKKKAMLSAAEYNAHLNQERREERRACFDLQTFTIHYPIGQRKPVTHSTKPGSYPVALLPGQFQDYYKQYTPEELKYLPVNTVLYGPLKEMNNLRIPSDDSDSDDSSASDGSGSSSQGTHDDSSSESDKNSKHNFTKTATVVLEKCVIPENMHRPKSKPNAICKICKRGKNEPGKEAKVEELVHCSDCENSGHPSCLDLTAEMVQVLKTYPWQCMDCKICSHCRDPYDEDKMLFCDLCDRGYHTFCVGLKSLPSGKWICHKCGSCTMCGARQPGPDTSKAQWQYDHAKTAPEAAANQRPKIMCQSCFKKKTTIK